MHFLRKQLILILCMLTVYAAYFLVHLPTLQQSPSVLGTSANLSLFLEPRDGKDPILSAIGRAQKEVDIAVYLLSDKDVIASLVSACARGVIVRILLEQHPFGGGTVNQKTMQQLQSSCVHVQWTNPSFALTHEKTITIDRSETFILNQNLTTSAFTKNREYDIVDANLEDALEVQHIFDADWARNSFSPSATNLVISPVTSRAMLTALLSESQQAIAIETEVMDDPAIIRLLTQKAQHEKVTILFPSFSQVGANKRIAKELVQAGIVVKTLSSPYIHAKLILSDNKKAYVGSVNLTTQSMDENREVGLILTQPDILTQLNDSFTTDWDSGVPVSGN